MKKTCVRVAIAGLGGRGKDTYAECSLRFPDKMKIVAIADPIPEKRREVAEKYGVAEEMCFKTAEELLERERLADILFICTQDKMHYVHAMKALEKGYHLLLEKPISPNAKECAEIAAAVKNTTDMYRCVMLCGILHFIRKSNVL